MRIIPTAPIRLLVLSTLDRAALGASGSTPVRLPLFVPRAAASGPSWDMITPGMRVAHPWDVAHQFVIEQERTVAAADAPYAEPDLVQKFIYQTAEDQAGLSFDSEHACRVSPPDDFWPPSQNLPFAYHLGDNFSQLAAARRRVGLPTGSRIRIAILDTGYDPNHRTLPRHLLTALARNFVDADRPDDATDPGSFLPGTNPGHGTATLALLAGTRVRPPMIATDFDDDLGGAPEAEIVPVRIANSVIHFRTSEMAQGLDYAVAQACAVVSLSMGGVPSRAWAEAINRAYEAGIVVCAAAGNNIGGRPITSIVYPARFNRVLAVCGITAAFEPYFNASRHWHMQGNFGPDSKMGTALAAFTPNVPWASMGCGDVIDVTGAGTSSATPQVAAAAALWLQQQGAIAGEPWQIVEAVRNALFRSANKNLADRRHYFGQGHLRASAALDVAPDLTLEKTPADDVSFSGLGELLGWDNLSPSRRRMFEVEALQASMGSRQLGGILGDMDPAETRLSRQEFGDVVQEMASMPSLSRSLRELLEGTRRRMAIAPVMVAREAVAALSSASAVLALDAPTTFATLPSAGPVGTAAIDEQFLASGFAEVIVTLGPDDAGLSLSQAARLPGARSVREMALALDRAFIESPDTQGAALSRAKGQAVGNKARVYPNLGVMLGYIDPVGLRLLKADPRVQSVTVAPRFSMIRPVGGEETRLGQGDYTWGLQRLKVPALRALGLTGEGVLVAHLDTGVDGLHPALKPAIAAFAEFDDMGDEVVGTTARDSDRHGTHTAGTIAGRSQPGQPQFGVAPGAKLLCAMVIEGGRVVARVLAGMDWAIEKQARVLNLSLGLRGYREDFLPVVRILRAKNVLPVVALGNEGPGTSRSPGNYPEALSVGACDENDAIPSFSSSQRFSRANDPLEPDLVAPGVGVLSCKKGGGYFLDSGTSMATPHISGLAALLLQAFPIALADQVEAAILASCARPATMTQERANRGVPDGLVALSRLASALGLPLPSPLSNGGATASAGAPGPKPAKSARRRGKNVPK